MAPTDNRPNPNRVGVDLAKATTVGGEVGCLTLIIVLGAVIGGIWLDRVLGTKPILTVLLVLGSAPLSLFLTFWVATQSLKDAQPKKPSAAEPVVSRKEENTSE